ncbi:hypothetical protein FIBSPDRAFT_1052681 [Athelia psychrophila]|uniref:Transmembrane protein n=1 Tax=Athelia psychrophila TaxID=1759441 RepID=A0A165WW22_9AGAM|nr:hypothetical protein FIBSPDRAFT_1052681 [Fibularhizoctonia sp. CBS 109695]
MVHSPSPRASTFLSRRCKHIPFASFSAFFCVSFRASSWSLWALPSMSSLRALSALCEPPCECLPRPAILRASYPNVDEMDNPSERSTSNQSTTPLNLAMSSTHPLRALHASLAPRAAPSPYMTPIVRRPSWFHEACYCGASTAARLLNLVLPILALFIVLVVFPLSRTFISPRTASDRECSLHTKALSLASRSSLWVTFIIDEDIVPVGKQKHEDRPASCRRSCRV